MNRPQLNDTILCCEPYSLFHNIFGYFCYFLFSHEKVVALTFLATDGYHRSFDADDVLIMLSNIGSNCHYFAYEPALKILL